MHAAFRRLYPFEKKFTKQKPTYSFSENYALIVRAMDCNINLGLTRFLLNLTGKNAKHLDLDSQFFGPGHSSGRRKVSFKYGFATFALQV